MVVSSGARAGWETEPGGAPLRRLFPHTPFDEREAAERAVAITAHQRELSARLGRNVGHSVAALDYLLNVRCDLVAPAIVESDLLEILERRSVTDPLTGLFNRYHFEATLKREVARSLRHGAPLSLLFMDVDRLKAVNDRRGHPAGDRVLGRVAAAIRNRLRSPDIASRYGGDEFAIILPETGARAGRLVAEQICAHVGASLGEGIGPDASTNVRVSGGLAEFPRRSRRVRRPVDCGSRSGAVPGQGPRRQLCSRGGIEKRDLDGRVIPAWPGVGGHFRRFQGARSSRRR